MRRYYLLLITLFTLVFIQGCSLPTPPDPTPTSMPSIIPSLTLALSPTLAATPTFLPTNSFYPTATQPSAATVQPSLTSIMVSEVTFFLVALEDQGQSGIPVGCGDSLVEITQPVETSSEPVRAALEHLFSFDTMFVGESGLYTALWQSNLRIDQVTVNPQGSAQVALRGEYALGGVCDIPRFQEQIIQTIFASPGVSHVEVTLNGQPLEEALSLR